MQLLSRTDSNTFESATTDVWNRIKCMATCLDVHKSVHRDTTMKITNKMHYIG